MIKEQSKDYVVRKKTRRGGDSAEEQAQSKTRSVGKQARLKKPKKQIWRLILEVLMMLVWAGSSVIASQIVAGYLMLWMMGAENFNTPVATAVYSALAYTVAVGLVVCVPALITRKVRKPGSPKSKVKKRPTLVDRTTLGLRDLPTWTDIGLAPVGYIIYILLAAGLVALFSALPWFNAAEAQEVGFSFQVSGFDRLVAFLTLVVIAPIAEEIIFRGWLYGSMREKIASRYSNTASIIISSLLVSLLFGIVHMQWNVGVNVFALSLVACGLREVTGTIYAGMLLHMVKNGVAFWLLYMV